MMMKAISATFATMMGNSSGIWLIAYRSSLMAYCHRLTVNFSENDVNARDARDHVGDIAPAHHVREGLQVHERRPAEMHAHGTRAAIAHHVDAEFALGRLDGLINFAGGGL